MTIKNVYAKHKEKILYLLFGAITTAISIAVFDFFTRVIILDILIANIISFIVAVFFAFLTNRKWVFTQEKRRPFFSSMLLFYSGRILTLIAEELILYIFIKRLFFDTMAVKITAQIVVIILNYIISKFIVFKSTKKKDIHKMV